MPKSNKQMVQRKRDQTIRNALIRLNLFFRVKKDGYPKIPDSFCDVVRKTGCGSSPSAAPPPPPPPPPLTAATPPHSLSPPLLLALSSSHLCLSTFLSLVVLFQIVVHVGPNQSSHRATYLSSLHCESFFTGRIAMRNAKCLSQITGYGARWARVTPPPPYPSSSLYFFLVKDLEANSSSL